MQNIKKPCLDLQKNMKRQLFCVEITQLHVLLTFCVKAADLEKIDRYHIPSEDAVSTV